MSKIFQNRKAMKFNKIQDIITRLLLVIEEQEDNSTKSV